MNTSILVIEDDPDIGELIAIYLRREGYRVDLAETAERGLRLFRLSKYDLLISDIMLPGMDGIQLVGLVRSESDVPFLFLSSKKTPQDIVEGLKLGGDDYITKPFEPEVLVARVQASLRRCRPAARRAGERSFVWDDGWLQIDKERLEVFVKGAPVALPAKELQLLLHLIENPKMVFSISQLYDRIWSVNGTSDDRTVMVHIHHLRKKIEKDPANPEYIVTIRGFGYKFGGSG